jgi:hypothetical protein
LARRKFPVFILRGGSAAIRRESELHSTATGAILSAAGIDLPASAFTSQGGQPGGMSGPRIETFQGELMKIRFAALFGALMLVSASAFAFHCPADMKKIDEAMAKNPKLSAQQATDVKKFRADGEALHKAGKHQESVDTLAKAMKILGI